MQLYCDIWLCIFDFLTLKSLANCAVINNEWRKYTRTALERKKSVRFQFNNKRWLSRDEIKYKNSLTYNSCKCMINHCKNIRFLDMMDNIIYNELFLQLLKTTLSVEFLSFSNVCSYSINEYNNDNILYESHTIEEMHMFRQNVERIISSLSSHKNLRLLLINSSITDEVVIMIADLIGPRLEGVQFGCLHLHSNITITSIHYLFEHCPNIKVFFLLDKLPAASDIVTSSFFNSRCQYLSLPYSDVTDEDCNVLSEKGHNLIELNIGTDKATINGLRVLSKGCKNLKSLSFSLHHEPSVEGVKFLCNPSVFPHLERIGIRSSCIYIEEMKIVLSTFKKMRPTVSVFDYYNKVSKGWCFPVFNFQSVIRRAKLL